MISILFLPCFLLVFGLFCTFSKIPVVPSKKLLSSLFSTQDLITTNNNKCIKVIPSQDDDHNSSSTIKSHQEKDHSSSSTSTSNKNNIMTNELTSVFATFDKNNDGYITKHELKESLKNIGISAEEKDVSEMIQRVDLNEDGLIDFDEFCELFNSIVNTDNKLQEDQDHDEGGNSRTRDQDLKEAFDVFDENRDGLITVEELGLVLSSLGFSEGNKLEDCREMIRRVDIDGDGMVNFDEFKVMMGSGFGRIVSVS